MTPLLLRPQPQQEASLRQRIGNGLSYPFVLAGERGEIRFRLAPEGLPHPATETFSCDDGILHIADAGGVCGLLSSCPLLLDPGENASWYWPLFNQHLSESVRALFGSLTQAASQTVDGLWLSISAISGTHQADSLLCLSPATLTKLLNRPGWHSLPAQARHDLLLTLPLSLGTLSLPITQLLTLRHDDVVFPAISFFSPSGHGVLYIAQRSLTGELLYEEGHPVRFHITDMENTYVNSTPEDPALGDLPTPDDSQESAATGATSPFDSLQLALTLRCGHLKLTLGELNRLAAGSTIIVEHVVPGEALLCHGEFPLAKGELVNVEGRLGLQITHMLPGMDSLLDMDR